jgi:hypothetical protein
VLRSNIRMSAIEREHARAHLRSAELTIDFVFMTVAKARLVLALVPRFAVASLRRLAISSRAALGRNSV